MTIKFSDKSELIIGSTVIPENITFRFSDILKIGGNGGIDWQDIILSGNGSLTLTNAKANGLNYLKLFGDTEQLAETYIDSVTLDGKCEQSGTPTPTVPVDIVCNNGTIKYSANMCNVNAQTALVGYYISASGVVTADIYNWIYQDFIPVKPNTTYTLTMSASVYYVSISEYSTAEDSGFVIRKVGSTGSNTTLTITTEATTNYVRFGTNLNRTAVTLEKVLAINWMLNVGNTMTYQPYVEGGIYTDGTTETVTDNVGNVATAERLLSVGNYKDTQEVLSGAVTRKIKVLVLDGTENWQLAAGSGYRQFYTTDTQGVIAGSVSLSSNIAPYGCTASTRANYQYGCYSGSSGNLCFQMIGSSTLTSVQTWTNYLSDQYNAGTPVIVVYPLATATTETVTGQFLSKEPVTLTGSLTGLVANVVSSSHTTPTPTQPLPINTNNGVLKVNSQGQIYTDGTVETVEVDTTGDTATAEMLLKVGDYQDEQNVINGHVTRNVGIKVLDGTENWTKSGNLFYAGIATDALEDTHSCYCTHFKGVATNASANYNNEIKVGTNATQTVNWTRVQIYPVIGTYSNVTAFKQWLAQQYANGTPVIVVYPLATATTETVTGQHLHIQAGTNIVAITQASIDNLPLEVSYKGTIEQQGE